MGEANLNDVRNGLGSTENITARSSRRRSISIDFSSYNWLIVWKLDLS